jgi:Zn-dependent M28 family amino/carboxypeptidase
MKEITRIQDNLKRSVYILSEEIGPRAYNQINALDRTVEYIVSEFRHYGYSPSFQSYEVDGRPYRNVYTEIKGTTDKLLVIGAHYDTVVGTPGADDNASGVAGVLELARLLRDNTFNHSIQFVAFSLEEPPFFYTKKMGSYEYAKSLHEDGRDLIGMICLESIGYFTDLKESQHLPFSFFRLFYPTTGNFIALVSNLHSKEFLKSVKEAFKKGTDLPVESISTVSVIPGIDFSDHRSFYKFDYKAIMVTDTAFYRNPNYHGPGDTPDTLDYRRMAEVVKGLKRAVEDL